MRQEVFQILNQGEEFLVLSLELIPFQFGETLERHIQDGLRLDLRQLELLHQAGASRVGIRATTDGGNNIIQLSQGDEQTFQNMRPLFGLCQFVFRPPPDDLLPMFQIKKQHAFE